MSSQPLISIIVPVYNVELYLPKCLDSLINQTLDNIEILLINDGSTDSSANICDDYAANDKRVRVFHIANAGVSNARNIGISNATGDYLMFIDSDDWIDVETSRIAYDKAVSSGAEIVFWSCYKEEPGKSFKVTYLENHSEFLVNNDVEKLKRRCIGLLGPELADPVKTDAFNTPWAKIYLRSFVLDSGVLFKERKKVGMEDVLFNVQLFQKLTKVAFLPEYFYHYRMDNPTSLTKVDTDAIFSKFNTLFDEMEMIPQKEDEIIAFRNRIAVSIINLILSITSKNNKVGFSKTKKKIDEILYNPRISNALNQLELKFFPIHWKALFLAAKYKQGLMLLIMMKVIRLIK